MASMNDALARMVPTQKAKQLDYHTILDGTFLEQLADEHNDAFLSLAPGRRVAPTLTLRWATICSGGEGVLFTLEAIKANAKKRGIILDLVHVYSCEIKKPLTNWIEGLFDEVGVAYGCCFQDAQEMGQEFATCVRHGGRCRVLDCDILISGTSCKDFSRASSSYKASDTLLLQQADSSVGGSVQTFRGFLAYVRRHPVSVILLENVDALDDVGEKGDGAATETNLAVLVKDVEAEGLACQVFLTDPLLFGLPQSRRRYYVLGLKCEAPPLFSFQEQTVAQTFAHIRAYVQLCQRDHPCASSLLSDCSDPSVESELNRRLAGGRRTSEYNVSASITLFKELGLRWGAVGVPDAIAQAPWYSTLTNLQQNALTYSYAQEPTGTLFRDISQSCARVRCSRAGGDGRHLAFCQMPAQVVWLEPIHGQPRLQLGRESLLIQGYPTAKIPALVARTSEAVMQGIAGNMMASVVTLAILQSTVAAVPWRSAMPCTNTTEHDVSFALSTFGLSTNASDSLEEQQGGRSEVRRRKIRRH